MDFDDTPVEAAFRREVKEWLARRAPNHERPPDSAYEAAELVARGRSWQKCRADGGYGAIRWPRAQGGREGRLVQSVIFSEEEARYSLPVGPFLTIGLDLALPTIFAHGTQDQIERFAHPTLTGQLTWCQLFSEPGAGSDLAGVRTRARRDGDHWVIDGQKVWTSWADFSDWGILLARSDSSRPKHHGLTYFLIDMKTPGIEVRPIRQISGRSEFSEVFFSDVRIPDCDRLGGEGEGWRVAITTLLNERAVSGGDLGEDPDVFDLLELAEIAGGNQNCALEDGGIQERIARWYAQSEGLKYFRYRLLTALSKGQPLGAEVALSKLVYGKSLQEMAACAMDLYGIGGVLADADAPTGLSRMQNAFFWGAVMRIAGGTDEILRNQIAERVLGLPEGIRIDKDVPFRDLKS